MELIKQRRWIVRERGRKRKRKKAEDRKRLSAVRACGGEVGDGKAT